MASGISTFGERGIAGTLGWENNELHRSVYLSNPQEQLFPFLNKLFGADPADSPLPFAPPFNNFRAWSVSFQTKDKGAQGDTEAADRGDFGALDFFPQVRGGVDIDVTYRPVDTTYSNFVSDEGWDFSAQTMSVIGNAYGNAGTSLTWATGGDPITNLTAIVKIIPKIEFVQTQVFCPNMPADFQRNLIGKVNSVPLFAGAADSGTKTLWPVGTVMLTGLPAIRRWRFDGQNIFQWGIKLAINMYRAPIATGTPAGPGPEDYVTWNRIYRPAAGAWDGVLVGPGFQPLYEGADLALVL